MQAACPVLGQAALGSDYDTKVANLFNNFVIFVLIPYICSMEAKKIMCPECLRKGYKTWLASAESVSGDGYLYFWCKREKKEIKIAIKDIAE